MPLVCMDYAIPAGGAPPIQDWATVFRSIVFSGLQLSREPIDLAVSNAMQGCELGEKRLSIVKGFTRATCLMVLCLAVSELDLSNPLVWTLLEPLHSVLDVAWLVPTVVLLLCVMLSVGLSVSELDKLQFTSNNLSPGEHLGRCQGCQLQAYGAFHARC